MSRGILYLAWKGENDPTAVLERSIKSIRHWHPEIEHQVVYMPDGSDLLCKKRMFELSPFDLTLFLDADTTVLGKLDYGFAKAQQFGIACCINANPCFRRYYNIPAHEDEVEYSSGVIFFDKTQPAVCEVFRKWAENYDEVDSSNLFMAKEGVRRQLLNDQALFSLAMRESGFNPFCLPLNWNLYPKWQKLFWGPLKILHGYDDIPAGLLPWNEQQSRKGSVIQCTSWPE